MSLAKDIVVKERTKDADVVIKVPSRTKKGVNYLVTRKDGEWECDCVSGQMRNQCRHIKEMASAISSSHKCFYCGTTFYAADGLDRHHVYRRSIRPELKDLEEHPENEMLLCRKCHDRATTDPEFEQRLQQVWQLKEKTQSDLKAQ